MVRLLRTGVLTAVVLSAAALAPVVFPDPVAAETIDRVLAVVAGQVITLSDVTAARDLGLRSAGTAADPLRAILSQLIDRELVADEVERYAPPEPPAGAIEREIAAVRARFPSPAAYDAVLARSGLDEQQLRQTLREDLRIRAYEEQRFVPSDPDRQKRIEEWIAGLRRRGDVIDLYLTGQGLRR